MQLLSQLQIRSTVMYNVIQVLKLERSLKATDQRTNVKPTGYVLLLRLGVGKVKKGVVAGLAAGACSLCSAQLQLPGGFRVSDQTAAAAPGRVCMDSLPTDRETALVLSDACWLVQLFLARQAWLAGQVTWKIVSSSQWGLILPSLLAIRLCSLTKSVCNMART